jgi:hypothetical protein
VEVKVMLRVVPLAHFLALFMAVSVQASPPPSPAKRSPAPPPIPEVLKLEFATEPVWVSAKAATAPDGTLDMKAFGESAGTIIDAVLKSPVAGGCRQVETCLVG